MLSFSYNKSIAINERLKTIDQLRAQILILPVSPRDLLQLRWEYILQRIRYSELLQGRSFTSKSIAIALSPFGRTKPKLNEKKIIAYKHAYDYLLQNWLVKHNQIAAEDISHIYNILGSPEIIPEIEDLKKALQYIQASNDHPSIQAALVHLTLKTSYPELQDLATLAVYLFLYKQGYDVNGLISIEDHIFQTKERYDKLIIDSTRSLNANLFIEYMAEGLVKNLTTVLTRLNEQKALYNPLVPAVDLNHRQQEIISLFDRPDVHITNRDIQKTFKVSQITASRDLARLAVLGLIFARGKGRSVYYTKV